MVLNFTTEEFQKFMNQKKNIRNMSIIGHVGYDKSNLNKSLQSTAGIFLTGPSFNPTKLSTSISMYFTLGKKDRKFIKDKNQAEMCVNGFLINLIDIPSQVDFPSEFAANFRISDGALVVVDCINGVCDQTNTALQLAIAERIKPVLFMNNMDLLILKLVPKVMYQELQRIVENINATYPVEIGPMGDIDVEPFKGNVGFGSVLQGWGFTLKQFAELYAEKFGIAVDKLMNMLWGENFYNPSSKKWSKKPEEGNERGFIMFVLDPIYKLFDAILNYKKEEIAHLLDKLNIVLNGDDKYKDGKKLLKVVMRTWLPLGETLLQMIVIHLPSPVTAQKYRMELFYKGPLNEAAVGIKTCNPNAPLMVYFSKMVPTYEEGFSYAFGRVFSGTLKPINIENENAEEKIRRPVVMMGCYVKPIGNVPCGNICGLADVPFTQIKTTKFPVTPVVQVAAESQQSSDLPKPVEDLNQLAESDLFVQVSESVIQPTRSPSNVLIRENTDIATDKDLNAIPQTSTLSRLKKWTTKPNKMVRNSNHQLPVQTAEVVETAMLEPEPNENNQEHDSLSYEQKVENSVIPPLQTFLTVKQRVHHIPISEKQHDISCNVTPNKSKPLMKRTESRYTLLYISVGFLVAVIIYVLGAIAYYKNGLGTLQVINFTKTSPSSPQIDVAAIVYDLMQEFNEQPSMTFKVVMGALRKINKFNPKGPVIIALLSEQGAANVTNRFAHQLARSVSPYSNVVTISGHTFSEQDPDTAKKAINDLLSRGLKENIVGAVFVDRLDYIPGDAALTFHSYCNKNAPFKHVVYIMTVVSNHTQLQLDRPNDWDAKFWVHLQKSWSVVGIDQISSLRSRLDVSVAAIVPESEG